MFYQIFLSPQVKRWEIITYKHGTYDFPYELPNDLTLFRMGGGGQKGPSMNFSPVTSTYVGNGPSNFLNFSFNTFATLMQNFNFVPSASPKLSN